MRNEDGTFKYTKAGANECARACDLIDPRSKDKVRKLPKEGSFSARGASYALRFCARLLVFCPVVCVYDFVHFLV